MANQMDAILDQLVASASEIGGELDAVAAEIASLFSRIGNPDNTVTQAMLDKGTNLVASLQAASARLKTFAVDPVPTPHA